MQVGQVGTTRAIMSNSKVSKSNFEQFSQKFDKLIDKAVQKSGLHGEEATLAKLNITIGAVHVRLDEINSQAQAMGINTSTPEYVMSSWKQAFETTRVETDEDFSKVLKSSEKNLAKTKNIIDKSSYDLRQLFLGNLIQEFQASTKTKLKTHANSMLDILA